DFDQRLFCWVVERARLAPLSSEDTRLLLTQSRAAKEFLTTHLEARISATLMSRETVDVTVTQKEFQEMTRPLVAKTLGPTRKALRDARLEWSEVKGVVMVGGAERVIPRNSTIPVARAQEFTTYKDGQTAMSIHVVQGERELVSDCRSLARFELRGIPPMVAGAARIRVTFQVDADGLLSVSARESATGVEAAIAVKPSYGLTDEQITQMLRDSFDHAREDVHLRALKEQQVEGGRMLEATEAALREDADLLSAEELAALRAELEALRKTLSCTDHRPIKSAVERVNRATEAFAGRRMDRSIKRALAGRKVESF